MVYQRRNWMRLIAISTSLAPLVVAALTFMPDGAFKGSSLTGWHVLGPAGWRARAGKLIGTAEAA